MSVLYLVSGSLLWAFSFGLIKDHLTGFDPWLVSWLRLAIAALVFLPWSLTRRPPRAARGPALALGALQFGLMYGLYIAAYAYLPAYGVALWTIFTPLYVVLLDAIRLRRLPPRAILAAGLAVAGAAVVLAGTAGATSLAGILLVQGSNLCFAAGQLGYRRLAPRVTSQAGLLGWMYLGAMALAAAGLLRSGAPALSELDRTAWTVLLYLGLVPTAAGFALWNLGAARVRSGILAVVNNLKIPLAVLVSWIIFDEHADHLRVLAGLGLVVGALFVAGQRPEKE